MLSATFFTLLYLLTRSKSFEHTAFHCLWGGVLFTPAAILTGFFSQWLNYPRESGLSVTIEAVLSCLLLAAAVIALIWRMMDPEVLEDLLGVRIIYLLLILSLTPMVTLTSYFGGLLTFPLEEDVPPPTRRRPGKEKEA